MIHSWVDFNLQIPTNALTFMLLLAFAWISRYHRDPQPDFEELPLEQEMHDQAADKAGQAPGAIFIGISSAEHTPKLATLPRLTVAAGAAVANDSAAAQASRRFALPW